MKLSELTRVIESVGKDRGIKKEIIVSALEQAIIAAAQKKYGQFAVMEAHYSEDSGEVDLYLFKKVVDSDDDMLEPLEEIKIEEARELDPDVEIGDEIGIKVETPNFGRIDAQTAKQIIFQKVRDAEREIIFNEFIHRKGDLITGIARRMERGNIVIDLGKTDALLPRSQAIPGEVIKPGDRVQAFLEDVVSTTRGPQIYLTRSSPKYVIKLFEIEVPEIREELIEIKGCSREAGARSKIAVFSKDKDVDPVGACVGMKGIRVQSVIQELKGEKIDIVPWSDNPVMFVQSSLSPAEISSIRLDERNKSMEIMVEDDQLSLAIGRKGQNVRLAAQLTGWRLDIISKSKLQKRTQEAVFNLQHLDGINETIAQAILQAGFLNVHNVANAKIEALQKIPGFTSEEDAKKLSENAKAIVEKVGDAIKGPEDVSDDEKGQFSAGPELKKDAKTLAEERLKEMFKQANSEEADQVNNNNDKNDK